jgi:EAL domain-containing protein (putative c-di-GMP-specific phosphodiesterase class I)/PleD family two-component response regulator
MDDCSARTRALAARLAVLAAPGATAAPQQLRDTMEEARTQLLALQARADQAQTRRMADGDGAVHAAGDAQDGGLVGPALFADRLGQALARAELQRQEVALVAISLHGYALLEDSLGDAAGRALLALLTARLGAYLRGGDTAAHRGGDRFALILDGLACHDGAGDPQDPYTWHTPHGLHSAPAPHDAPSGYAHLMPRLRAVLAAIALPTAAAGEEIEFTCHLGVSLYPLHADGAAALLQHADTAAHCAEQIGSNSIAFYRPDSAQAMPARLKLQRRLRLALERDEFLLHYQPQVDLRDGTVVGAEALIRWQSPEGLVPPGEFIGLAEQSDLILAIGAWVLLTACEQAQRWNSAGHATLRMAVNLSARQFAQPGLVDMVARILDQTGLPPAQLEIELTETVVMQDLARSTDTLRALKRLGVQLSIDDFGTGYSSLAYLKRFPIDALKIDQSFVRDLGRDDDDAAIVKAIISMAHSMGVRVIAEGVETDQQCAYLRDQRCDEIQGYLFSRPLPASQWQALLTPPRRLPGHLCHPAARQPTLLLVDDDAHILAALVRLLRRTGLTILTAADAAQALAVLARAPVDVVVSDQRMPGMSGTELLALVKRDYPDAVRVMLTGYADLGAVMAAVNQGAVYLFLTKPWDGLQLRTQLDQALRHKALADDNRRLALELSVQSQNLARLNRELKAAAPDLAAVPAA